MFRATMCPSSGDDGVMLCLVLVFAVTMRGVIQICLSVSGLCVVMWIVVGGGFIVVSLLIVAQHVSRNYVPIIRS